MSNIYKGMLMVPVRVEADSPWDGLEKMKQASTKCAGVLRGDSSVYTYDDTYRETQASIQVEPVVTNYSDNVVQMKVGEV